MGCWSTDILGGDTPMDFEDEIYDICKVEKFKGEKINNIPSEILEKNMVSIMEMINEYDGDDEWNIGYQVLAVLMLASGSPIRVDLKSNMIKACNDDEWSNDDSERRQKVNALKEAINKYDGKTPIVITSKGLFQTIAENIADGKTGLVNK